MASQYTLETERLTLKLFDRNDPSHYEKIIKLISMFETAETPERWLMRTPEALNERVEIEKVQGKGAKIPIPCPFWYLIFLRGSETFIGIAGVQERWKYPDIGWALSAEFRGQGYANEAARELLKFLTSTVGLTEVFAAIKEPNPSSVKVAERIGLKDRGKVIIRSATGRKDKFFAYMLEDMKPFPDGFEMNYYYPYMIPEGN